MRCAAFAHFEGERVGALRELKRNGGHGGSGAVLDGQGEVIAIAAQVEVGVAPGVELGGAAQGLAGSHAAGAVLGVVDDDHGHAESSLQLAQIGEQRRYLAAGVLVDAMQAHEGIEHEQTRRELGDRLVEAFVFYSVCATEPCSLGGCEAISFLVFLARFLASAAAAISSMVLTTAGIGLPKRLT